MTLLKGLTMVSDCWTDKECQEVLNHVRNHLWLYVHEDASIEELRNVVKNLTSLDRMDLDYLATVHFLLSNEVKEFVKTVLAIFRRISHSTQREVIVNRGFVRGIIDWSRTLKERYSKGYDPTIFVCRPTARIYNLPENQLLKFILVKIKRLIEETAALPKVEEKSIRLEELKTEDGKEKWTDRLSWIKFHVNRALRHVYLREVETPNQVSARMLRRAKTARNKDYIRVVDSYSLHNRIIQRMDRETLEELVEKRVLEPLEKDTLYELYVLFEVMDALGKPEEINLIKRDAKAIGIYRIGEERVYVYFQRVKGLFEESEYKRIFEDYALDVSSRRPDIILHFLKQGKFLIVEVKRTTDRDYIVDSVYKVLGYLADFKKYFSEEQKPKAVLVVWNIQRLRKTEQEVSILARNEVSEYIREMISARAT